MSGITREEFILKFSTFLFFGTFMPKQFNFKSNKRSDLNMYGLIGKITAKNGKRDQLIKILLEGTENMPGCLNYIVSKDMTNENSIWVTEVWESQDSHKNSLTLPSVQEAIKKGMPLIEEFDEQLELEPIGGIGLN
jgi:quinol monooxygenase YgiN